MPAVEELMGGPQGFCLVIFTIHLFSLMKNCLNEENWFPSFWEEIELHGGNSYHFKNMFPTIYWKEGKLFSWKTLSPRTILPSCLRLW